MFEVDRLVKSLKKIKLDFILKKKNFSAIKPCIGEIKVFEN